MKGIFFTLVLALVFFLPRHSSALESKQGPIPYSLFQYMQNENNVVSDNSQSTYSFFDDDLSDKDDDDINHAARKKFSFGGNSFSAIVFPALPQVFFNDRNIIYSSLESGHLPPSHFISLKVFRL